jgi:hippurate hydrolase
MPAENPIDIEALYKDLHRHPELSFAEHRTAGIVADHLTELGYAVTTGVGRTGVVGVLENGEGPTVLLRADMDGLPVEEATGLEYASTARGTDPDGTDVPVMHACGHDVHVACLIGAAEKLVAERAEWAGTVVALFQPAEELGSGANAMVDDGLYERFPKPDIVLGQHVGPAPAGTLGAHPGPAFAATDDLTIRMIGQGGHGSRPETTVDPILMASATVMRLQGIISREIAGSDTAVVTVGTLNAGTKSNIIPPDATLGINVRSYNPEVRDRVLAAIDRIARAEACASGAVEEPEIIPGFGFAALVNYRVARVRTLAGFRAHFGADRVVDRGAVTGSEDVGGLATAADAPIVYWILGGADAHAFAAAAAAGRIEQDIPSNHSPHFAPVIQPTLATGVAALSVAARTWLGAAN